MNECVSTNQFRFQGPGYAEPGMHTIGAPVLRSLVRETGVSYIRVLEKCHSDGSFSGRPACKGLIKLFPSFCIKRTVLYVKNSSANKQGKQDDEQTTFWCVCLMCCKECHNDDLKDRTPQRFVCLHGDSLDVVEKKCVGCGGGCLGEESKWAVCQCLMSSICDCDGMPVEAGRVRKNAHVVCLRKPVTFSL